MKALSFRPPWFVCHTFARALLQLIETPTGLCYPDDWNAKVMSLHQRLMRRKDLFVREVPCCAEKDEGVRPLSFCTHWAPSFLVCAVAVCIGSPHRAFRGERVSRPADFRGGLAFPMDGIVTKSNAS